MTPRLPSLPERRKTLREGGWQPHGGGGASEAWRHERYGSNRFFTLRLAYRIETGLVDPDAMPVDAG